MRKLGCKGCQQTAAYCSVTGAEIRQYAAAIFNAIECKSTEMDLVVNENKTSIYCWQIRSCVVSGTTLRPIPILSMSLKNLDI